jgi:hypothetical protein
VPAGSHEAMLTVDTIHPGLPMCEGTGAGPGCNDAPTFVDAQPMPAGFCLNGRCGLVWLHFWLLWHADLKRLGGREVVHFGDWEHLCALVEADAHGDLAREPVAIHWHHHGAADIATGSEAVAYRADAFGVRHPVAFVEALSHGIWEKPDPSAGRSGGGSPDNPLDNPLVFMTGHPASLDDPTNEVFGRFTGRWGQSDRSPIGPLQFNSRCDHDYLPRPSGSDWAREGC